MNVPVGIEFGDASEYEGRTQVIVRYDHNMYKNRPHLRIYRKHGDVGWSVQRYLHDPSERIQYNTDYLTIESELGLTAAKALAARLIVDGQ